MILRVLALVAALVVGYLVLRVSFELIGPLPTIGICAAIAIVTQIAARRRA